MNRSTLALLLGTLSALPMAANAQELGSSSWNDERAQVTLVQHLGRESLLLKSGVVWLPDIEFLDGTLEFDVSFTGERGFIGALFRMQEVGDAEHVYLRPHQSGNPDASQYTPTFNGCSAWQLYGESTAPIDFKLGAWNHVRVEVWGSEMRLAVNSGSAQLVSRLRRPVEAGAVGLVVGGGYASAHYSNFRVTPMEEAPFAPSAPEVPAIGIVPHWSVSSAFAGTLLGQEWDLAPQRLGELAWEDVNADPNGTTNLAKRQGPRLGADTCLARTVLHSSTEQRVLLNFGYSDRVQLFLNGKCLFRGDNTYALRDYRFLGTLGPFDQLVLPLRKGPNELVMAVGESFGGWGLSARVGKASCGGTVSFERSK